MIFLGLSIVIILCTVGVLLYISAGEDKNSFEAALSNTARRGQSSRQLDDPIGYDEPVYYGRIIDEPIYEDVPDPGWRTTRADGVYIMEGVGGHVIPDTHISFYGYDPVVEEKPKSIAELEEESDWML